MCTFLFQYEEAGSPCLAVLVWKFKILQSGTTIPIKAKNSKANHLVGMPLMATDLNCICFRLLCNKIVLTDSILNDVSTIIGPTNGNNNDSSETIHGIKIFCAGSLYFEYQSSIKSVRQFMAKNGECVVDIVPERNNIRDKNALTFVGKCGDSSFKIGYVPVNEIPKVQSVIVRQELVKVVVDEIRKVYVKRKNKAEWKAWIRLLKKT